MEISVVSSSGSLEDPLLYLTKALHMWLVGCPYPEENGTKIAQYFFKTLYPYENVMSNKQNFYQWTNKIPAKQHSQSGPDCQNLG